MKIGIDGNLAIYEKAGIGKYTTNLIKALLEYDRKNEYVLFFNFFRHPAERMQAIKNLVKDSKAHVKVRISRLPAAWKERLTQASYPLKNILKEDVDLYHATYFSGIPKVGFSKMTVTMYDLAFMKYPEHRGKKLSNYYFKRTKQAIAKTKKIIVPSLSTKKDLIEYFKVPPSKIVVIPLGVGKIFRVIRNSNEIKQHLRKYKIKSDFILSVCTLEPRKNLPRLVQAYTLLPHQLQQKYQLVLVGGEGWNNQELVKIIHDLNLKEKVALPGYVPEEDLPYFYNQAKVFVYPSLYEGFGLPVLEALSCGAPVITSNVSSMPEVAGKAAILINPYKEEEIASALRKVLASEKLQESLSRKGIVQAKKFSWRRTAEETLKVFQKVAK